MDEQECIRRCQTGDWNAFEPIFRAHIPMAVRTAYLITRDWGAAEDAAQEAFIRACRAIRSFRPGNAFAPWLYRIVVNEARRVAARPRPLPLMPAALEALAPAPDEQHAGLWEAVGSLDEEHRTVLVLKYFRGFTEAEIATVLDLRQTTVKSRLYVARQRMLALLGRKEEVEA